MGIWSWKPLRALSHIRMQRIGCLFSVKVVRIQGLPASTDGLRLSVAVRKKETKEGTLRTMPSQVIQGSADFVETLFVRCHLYCNGKPPVFEPRLFLISGVAVDAPELHLGVSTVDLSLLVKESVERSFEGARVREWDMSFELTGKAKGGVLVLKLGFQIMEEGGVSIYSQAEDSMKKNKGKDLYFSSTRKESMSSFSSTTTLSVRESKSELEVEPEDQDFSKLEIIDKGIEKVAERCQVEEAKSKETVENISASREVVKEVVHRRMMDLESIAKEIKALESAMSMDGSDVIDTIKRNGQQNLDAEEETVTRKFLQMLEGGDNGEPDQDNLKTASKKEATAEGGDTETMVLPDLGKGLGPVVQTKDGGYLVSMNPLDMKVEREETPKLAMQISRPFILQVKKQGSGLEVFQRLAAMGSEELTSKLSSLTAMDELMGKTAGQVAFEGVASAIISGRSKEGASFSAARSIATAKMMAKAMIYGKKERTSNSVRKAEEEPITMEEILAFSMQKKEAIVMEGLMVYADMAEEDTPDDVSSLNGKEEVPNHLLDSAISLEEWKRTRSSSSDDIKLLVAIQLRDPIRKYEPVGGLQIAVLQAMRIVSREDEEAVFKVTGIHVGGMKLSSVEGQRQRLTAMQWLVGMGMGKAGWQKKKVMEAKTTKDMVWSFSSILEEDIWLKPSRNPSVKFM